MKKSIALSCLYLLGLIQSCICPNNGFSTTYITIESARGLFYSFNQNGIFPELDSFNRTELGISIMADSTTERIEVAQVSPSLLNSAYACEDPHSIEYENFIDSVTIFTRYEFDSSHPAGSSVNDIVEPMDHMGETTSGVNIKELWIVNNYFKFSAIPTADSMQFVITGRISGKGNFEIQTDLTVLLK